MYLKGNPNTSFLEKTVDGGFVLADTIRSRYENARDQVGTKSALSRHQVDILTVYKSEQGIMNLLTLVDRTNRTKFRQELLNPLLENGVVEMTIPV